MVFVSLLALTGCRNEMEETAMLRLSLCLPNQEQSNPNQRRVLGDPGTTEIFELPKYAYILVLKDNGDGTWSIWRREECALAAENWIRTRYYGLNSTREDSIFMYNKKIQFLLRNEAVEGKVFAICSNMKLNFNTAFNNVSSLTQVLNWKFDSSPDSIQENLQNIYSTPYNYIRDGKYYCSFDCSQNNVFSMDLLMYHIAAKVDIKWNVDEEKRINKEHPENAVRLTYMEAHRLFNGFAYCFQPMKNEVVSLPETGYDIPDIVTPADEGLWWEGRTYFYTIPYTTTASGKEDYFPLQMRMGTNDSTKYYQPTIYLEIDKTSPFVPWLCATFNLSASLTEGTEDKMVEK